MTQPDLAGLVGLVERARESRANRLAVRARLNEIYTAEADAEIHNASIEQDVAENALLLAAFQDLPALLARIAAVESENETLRDALEPFANKARKWEAQHPDAVYPDANSTTISHRLGDFRFARTAVTLKEKDDG